MEIYETIFRFLYNILSVYVGYRTIELFLVSKKIKWGKKALSLFHRMVDKFIVVCILYRNYCC